MNKKQRNRKDVQQNMRNRLINKRYTTTIKTLSKLFDLKITSLKMLKALKIGQKKKLLL